MTRKQSEVVAYARRNDRRLCRWFSGDGKERWGFDPLDPVRDPKFNAGTGRSLLHDGLIAPDGESGGYQYFKVRDND